MTGTQKDSIRGASQARGSMHSVYGSLHSGSRGRSRHGQRSGMPPSLAASFAHSYGRATGAGTKGGVEERLTGGFPLDVASDAGTEDDDETSLGSHLDTADEPLPPSPRKGNGLHYGLLAVIGMAGLVCWITLAYDYSTGSSRSSADKIVVQKVAVQESTETRDSRAELPQGVEQTENTTGGVNMGSIGGHGVAQTQIWSAAVNKGAAGGQSLLELQETLEAGEADAADGKDGVVQVQEAPGAAEADAADGKDGVVHVQDPAPATRAHPGAPSERITPGMRRIAAVAGEGPSLRKTGDEECFAFPFDRHVLRISAGTEQDLLSRSFSCSSVFDQYDCPDPARHDPPTMSGHHAVANPVFAFRKIIEAVHPDATAEAASDGGPRSFAESVDAVLGLVGKFAHILTYGCIDLDDVFKEVLKIAKCSSPSNLKDAQYRPRYNYLFTEAAKALEQFVVPKKEGDKKHPRWTRWTFALRGRPKKDLEKFERELRDAEGTDSKQGTLTRECFGKWLSAQSEQATCWQEIRTEFDEKLTSCDSGVRELVHFLLKTPVIRLEVDPERHFRDYADCASGIQADATHYINYGKVGNWLMDLPLSRIRCLLEVQVREFRGQRKWHSWKQRDWNVGSRLGRTLDAILTCGDPYFWCWLWQSGSIQIDMWQRAALDFARRRNVRCG